MHGRLQIKMEDKSTIKRFILETELQTNLQIASVSIVIVFTYLIGASIAILSRQINWDSPFDRFFFFSISSFIVGISSSFFIQAVNKIRRIIRASYNMMEEKP